MDKRCPKCRLINPPEAERCDCGWDFVMGRQEGSYIRPKREPVKAGVGAAIFLAVVVIVIRLVLIYIRSTSAGH